MTDDEHPVDDLQPGPHPGGRPGAAGRAWVHPSELPVFDRGAPEPRRTSSAGTVVRTFTTPVLSGLLGAAVALVVAAAMGAFDRPTRVQVIERTADTSASSAAPTTTDDPEVVAAAARRAMPALVQVKMPPELGGAVGTGLTISSDGIVVTSAVLVAGSTRLEIVDGGGRTHTAELVGSDPESGLAVLRADTDDLVVADLAEQGPQQVGETAIVVGAPSGYQTTGSVAVGVIAGINRVVATSDQMLYGMLEIDRPIPDSACGGAVLDRDGLVVAVPVSWPEAAPAPGPTVETLTNRSETSALAGLAVPIDQVKVIAAQILEQGHVEHAWLGVVGRGLSADAASRMGVGGGIEVTTITPDSPAAVAGVTVGDVLTAVDGTAISEMAALLATVRAHDVGATIWLTIMRPGAGREPLSIEVTLADKPAR